MKEEVVGFNHCWWLYLAESYIWGPYIEAHNSFQISYAWAQVVSTWTVQKTKHTQYDHTPGKAVNDAWKIPRNDPVLGSRAGGGFGKLKSMGKKKYNIVCLWGREIKAILSLFLKKIQLE